MPWYKDAAGCRAKVDNACNMAFTLEQLDHVVLIVANIAATTDFYTEVLGMDLVTIDGRKALAFGMQVLHLYQRGHEPKPGPAHPMPGSNDFCFITNTPLEEVASYLAEQRIHVESGPVERAGALGKLRAITLRDPDQNLIQIAKYL